MSVACETSSSVRTLGVMWKTVSEDCNLACDYCYYSRVGGKIGGHIRKIEEHVLEKFIREYMAMTSGHASFAWQGGEPLLAGLDFFKKVVELEAKYAPPHTVISNAVQTNATLVTPEIARFFRRYNFLIGVSIDGPKHVHDARRVNRGGGGSFDRVMQGVQHLREAGADFNVLTVVHEGNVHCVRELFDFYMQEKFDYVQFIPCMDFRAQETHKQPHYLISPEEYGDFLCEAFDVWYNDGEPRMSVRFFDNLLAMYVQQEAELCVHRRTCPETLILEQNGDAYPCDFFISDDYRLGNVAEDALTEILGNYAHRRFLNKKPNLPEQCTTCCYQHLCHGGCPRNRVWGDFDEAVDVDYFCASYQQIYRYAHERMEHLAQRVKQRNLREYLSQGGKPPGRNEACICGSGKKYKKCCEPLLHASL